MRLQTLGKGLQAPRNTISGSLIGKKIFPSNAAGPKLLPRRPEPPEFLTS
jgi:hypothetical protein